MDIMRLFPHVGERVKALHEAVKMPAHHDWWHDVRVSTVAYNICVREYDARTAELACLAGAVHSADRLLEAKHGRKISVNTLISTLEDLLSPVQVDSVRLGEVCLAVVEHAEINHDKDGPVKICLQDADRVVNLSYDIAMRSALLYAEKYPLVDTDFYLDALGATYAKPGSVLRDVAYCLDWVNPQSRVCIRTKHGMELAKPRAERLLRNLEAFKRELEEEGIVFKKM